MKQSNLLSACLTLISGIGYGIVGPAGAKAYSEGAQVMAILIIRAAIAAVLFSSLNYVGVSCNNHANDDDDNKEDEDEDEEIDSQVDSEKDKNPCDASTDSDPAANDAAYITCAPAYQESHTLWFSCAIAGQIGWSLCYMTCFLYMPISVATLVTSTYPLVVFIIAVCTEPRQSRPGFIAAVLHVVAFVGLAVALVGPRIIGDEDEDANGESPEESATGYILAFGAALSFGLQSLGITNVLRLGTNPTKAVGIVNYFNVAILAIVYGLAVAGTSDDGGVFRWGMPNSPEGHGYAWLSIAFYSICQITIFAAFGTAQDPSKVAFLLNVEPIVSILFGITLFDERFVWYQWIGLITMVVALSLSSMTYSSPKLDEEEEGSEGAVDCDKRERVADVPDITENAVIHARISYV